MEALCVLYGVKLSVTKAYITAESVADATAAPQHTAHVLHPLQSALLSPPPRSRMLLSTVS